MSEQILDQLKKIEISELKRDALDAESAPMLIGQLRSVESQSLAEVIAILEGAELKELINQGKVTVGMLKPALHESITPERTEELGEVSDSEIAQEIIGRVKLPLEALFTVSFTMTPEMADTFYQGKPKEAQSSFPPMEANRYGQEHATRWDEFKALMTRGPVTFILWFEENGNAISEWRNQMGNHWNVDKLKVEQPGSLRASWALDNHNNIFHGSDSVESVQREVAFVTSLLSSLKS